MTDTPMPAAPGDAGPSLPPRGAGGAGSLGDPVIAARQPVRRLLLVGVAAAATLLVAGLALEIARGQLAFTGGARPIGSEEFWSGLTQGVGGALIASGLLVLALTPVARVVVAAGYFASYRDRSFTYLTAFVLFVLALSVVVGLVA